MALTVENLFEKALLMARGPIRVRIAEVLDQTPADLLEAVAGTAPDETDHGPVLSAGFEAACHKVIRDALGGGDHKAAMNRIGQLLDAHRTLTGKKGEYTEKKPEQNPTLGAKETAKEAGGQNKLGKDSQKPGETAQDVIEDEEVGDSMESAAGTTPKLKDSTIISEDGMIDPPQKPNKPKGPKVADAMESSTPTPEKGGELATKPSSDGLKKSKQSTTQLAESRELELYRRGDDVVALCESLGYRPDKVEIRAMAALSDAERKAFVRQRQPKPAPGNFVVGAEALGQALAKR